MVLWFTRPYTSSLAIRSCAIRSCDSCASPCRPPSPSHLLPMQASLSLSPPPHAGLPLPLTLPMQASLSLSPPPHAGLPPPSHPPPHAGLPLPLTSSPCRPPSPSHLLPMQASLSLSPPPHAGLPLPLTLLPMQASLSPPPSCPILKYQPSFFLANIMMWEVAQKPLLSMVSSHYTSFIIIINCSIALPLHPLALTGNRESQGRQHLLP